MVTISTADDDETTITTPKEVANVLKKLSGSDQSKKDLRCVCVCVCVCGPVCVGPCLVFGFIYEKYNYRCFVFRMPGWQK